jgi:hypothetical protein
MILDGARIPEHVLGAVLGVHPPTGFQGLADADDGPLPDHDAIVHGHVLGQVADDDALVMLVEEAGPVRVDHGAEAVVVLGHPPLDQGGVVEIDEVDLAEGAAQVGDFAGAPAEEGPGLGPGDGRGGSDRFRRGEGEDGGRQEGAEGRQGLHGSSRMASATARAMASMPLSPGCQATASFGNTAGSP